MSATTGALSHARPLEPAARSPARIIVALTSAESRRLLRHPAFLVGAGLSVYEFVAYPNVKPADVGYGFFSNSVGAAYFNLTGWGVMPLALATLIALNLAALRSARHHTDDLYAALPVPARARTAACLIASVCGLAIAAVLVAAAYRYLGAKNGLIVDYNGLTAAPSVYELAQGPLVVAVFGVLGVALAVWLPRLGAAFTVLFALFVTETLLGSWVTVHDGLRWLLPFANSATFTRPHANFPEGVPRDHGVNGFDVAGARWHLLYLAALAIVFAALALVRHSSRRRVLAACSIAPAVVVAAALPQIVWR
jgi:hypothetical protein